MGYRIQIDHGNCINCGVCMDVCPVEALDMTRPDRPGVEAGPGGKPAALDDGVPGPGRRVHRLLDLHPGMPGRGHDPRHRRRPHPARRRARAGSTGRSPTGGWIPLVRGDPRGAQADQGLALRRRQPLADPQPAEALAGLDVDGRRRRAGPRRAVPGRLSGRHRRRPVRRADRRRSLRRRVRGRRRGQPVPVGLRLDLHGAVRDGLPPRHARRADRDPDPQALRGRARQACPRSTRPTIRRPEKVAIVGGGPAGMSAAYYLARLGYGVTVLEAMPVPGGMMAIGIPEYRLPREVLRERDRPDRRSRRRAPARRGDGPRLHPQRSRGPGLPGRLPGHRRTQEPAARASPATTSAASSRGPSSSSRSTSARRPG